MYESDERSHSVWIKDFVPPIHDYFLLQVPACDVDPASVGASITWHWSDGRTFDGYSVFYNYNNRQVFPDYSGYVGLEYIYEQYVDFWHLLAKFPLATTADDYEFAFDRDTPSSLLEYAVVRFLLNPDWNPR